MNFTFYSYIFLHYWLGKVSFSCKAMRRQCRMVAIKVVLWTIVSLLISKIRTWIELRYSAFPNKISRNFFSHLVHSCAYVPLVESNLSEEAKSLGERLQNLEFPLRIYENQNYFSTHCNGINSYNLKLKDIN